MGKIADSDAGANGVCRDHGALVLAAIATMVLTVMPLALFLFFLLFWRD